MSKLPFPLGVRIKATKENCKKLNDANLDGECFLLVQYMVNWNFFIIPRLEFYPNNNYHFALYRFPIMEMEHE